MTTYNGEEYLCLPFGTKLKCVKNIHSDIYEEGGIYEIVEYKSPNFNSSMKCLKGVGGSKGRRFVSHWTGSSGIWKVVAPNKQLDDYL